jgi:signal transduction histidine kinase
MAVGSVDDGGGERPGLEQDLEEHEQALRRRYLLRVVRIGVLATVVVLAVLALVPFVAAGIEVPAPGLYWAVIVAGLLGAVGVGLLPWPRLLATRRPMVVFYLWSLADIVLISVAIVATDGMASPLWSVYALTTLFFAAAYPRRSQVVLLAVTALAYAGAVAVAEASLVPHLGDLLVRVGVLSTLAMMGAFLARELTAQMTMQARRAQASRRVARAGANIASLQRQDVFDAAVRATLDLGFPACAVVLVEGRTYKLAAAHGLPPRFERVRLALSDLRDTDEAWVMRREDIDDPDVLAVLDDIGGEVLVAAPLVLGERRVGVLAAVGDAAPTSIEALQMLGTLTSSALENAELYRLKTDFVANVSHELRTPLTVLLGLGDTLSRRASDMERAQLAALASRITANAQRLESTISTLLDFSRLQAAQRLTDVDAVDLGAMAAEVLERHVDRLAPRAVALEAAEDAVVHGDRVMLEQVLDNLLANVADHTPPSTHVTVTIAPRPAHEEVEVAVADDGPGIAPEDLERLTDRFYRGGDHLTRERAGLGLGLALVQELLALHGSALEVETQPRGGTRFVFRLVAPTSAGDRQPDHSSDIFG